MTPTKLDMKFQVHIKILKPVEEVFDGVYNPEKLMKYFTTAQASGPLDEGKTVTWEFADYPGPFPVKVLKCERNRRIVLEWDGMQDAPTQVEFLFESIAGGTETEVKVSETGWEDSQRGLNLSYGNCFGWGQMICCLKAYLEYGINLRRGAF